MSATLEALLSQWLRDRNGYAFYLPAVSNAGDTAGLLALQDLKDLIQEAYDIGHNDGYDHGFDDGHGD